MLTPLSWAEMAGADPMDPAPATTSGCQVAVPLVAQ
jgi:hypothetical protein